MNCRVRYIKTNEPDVLESMRNFACGAKTYKIRYNTKDLSYAIFDANSEIIEASGTGSTLHILKKRIKASLKELGVAFDTEVRTK